MYSFTSSMWLCMSFKLSVINCFNSSDTISSSSAVSRTGKWFKSLSKISPYLYMVSIPITLRSSVMYIPQEEVFALNYKT